MHGQDGFWCCDCLSARRPSRLRVHRGCGIMSFAGGAVRGEWDESPGFRYRRQAITQGKVAPPGSDWRMSVADSTKDTRRISEMGISHFPSPGDGGNPEAWFIHLPFVQASHRSVRVS